MTDKNTREIIESIHNTVADQSLWGAVLDRIAESVNARGCLIFELDRDGDLMTPFMSSFYKPDFLQEYFEKHLSAELADQDAFLAHIRKHDAVDIIPDSILFDDVEEFKARANVRAVMKQGLLHRAAAQLNKDNTDLSRFSVQFKSDRGGITELERATLNTYLPHIAKALDQGRPIRQLTVENQGLLAAVERLNIGICIIDSKGRVALENNEFTRQRETFRVFDIDSKDRLRLFKKDDQQRFETLKADVLNHGKFGARPRKEAIATGDEMFLCIEMTPLKQVDEIGKKDFGGFILCSTDTSLPILCDPRLIGTAYGLTPAEIDVVGGVSEGLTNSEIAERRDSRAETVKTQVKHIFEKTGCGSRTQLVRMMMSFGMDYLADRSKKR